MTQTPTPTGTLIRRLFKNYIMNYKREIIIALMAMIIGGMMTAANAYMMKPVLDDIFIDRNETKLYVIPAIILLIAVISSISNYTRVLYVRYVGSKIIADMQIELFAHLLRSDLRLFYDQSAGRLISRFTNDINMIRSAISTTTTALAKEFITMIFLVAVMLYQSGIMTLIAMVAFAGAIYPLMRFGKRSRKISGQTQAELGEFTNQLDDIFQGVRTVKAYNREDYEIGRATGTINKLFDLYFKAARIQAISSPAMEMISGLAIASVILYGGMQVMHGHTTPGAFFSFITAFIMAYRPMKALAGLNNAMQEGLAAADRYFDAIDTKPQIKDVKNAHSLEVSGGEIKFDKVTFHYEPGSGGVRDINLHIKPGQKVALVGPSGGGKSTMMNLLMRFYDVDSGQVFIDGQDIHTVTQHSLRHAYAFVPQEPMLFDDTVYANIAYGRADATKKEVEEAARMAAAHDFITALPEGYNTQIGPHGVKISGGQRQRLAIARAMLKNAPILLLDEATSALDNESERLVQQALDKLMENRTTLMIAHRLSTIEHADMIVVIDQGQIVETGTHQELMARQAAYFRLQQAAQNNQI